MLSQHRIITLNEIQFAKSDDYLDENLILLMINLFSQLKLMFKIRKEGSKLKSFSLLLKTTIK